MNIKTGDAKLVSLWETDAVIANGLTYGIDIPMDEAGRFLTGRIEIEFYIMTAFTGAGDVALSFHTGATASPTGGTKVVFTGLKTALTVGVSHKLVLNTHEMDKFVRLSVNNTGAASTGALRARLNTIKS